MKIQKFLKGSIIYQMDRLIEALNNDRFMSFKWEDYKKDFEYESNEGVHTAKVILQCISAINGNDVYSTIEVGMHYYENAPENKSSKIYCLCYNDINYEEKEFILSRDEKEFIIYMRFPYEN